LALALVFMFNNLVALRNRVDNAWAQIDVQLQRRNDLIPNLVETVKGYAGHEKSTFQAVIDARSASVSARTVDEKAAAENQITSALRQLFALAEAYPELKANTNFLDLQGQLAGTEDKISYMRQSYNDTVLNYNNAIQTFPGVVVAGIFSFKPRENFDAIIEAETPPQVQF
jgi:LemA protein